MPHPSIHAILVPQGAEYRAVCRGLKQTQMPVFPIPVGAVPLSQSLEILKQDKLWQSLEQPQVLLMGLCGSLSPDAKVGDVVVCESCVSVSSQQVQAVRHQSEHSSGQIWCCAQELTQYLEQVLYRVSVKAITSDRVIHSASEKQLLGAAFNAAVVDMEGAIVLESLKLAGVSVAMLRVVSDDCHHDLPNLNLAFRVDGSLNTAALTLSFLKNPIAAFHLIRGATHALQALQFVTTSLFHTA
jgi:purine-nucleoside phosphorylase